MYVAIYSVPRGTSTDTSQWPYIIALWSIIRSNELARPTSYALVFCMEHPKIVKRLATDSIPNEIQRSYNNFQNASLLSCPSILKARP